jgi:hypothetical protein
LDRLRQNDAIGMSVTHVTRVGKEGLNFVGIRFDLHVDFSRRFSLIRQI